MCEITPNIDFKFNKRKPTWNGAKGLRNLELLSQ